MIFWDIWKLYEILTSVSINKISLEQSHIFSLMYFLWLFLHCNCITERLWQRSYDLQCPKSLLLSYLQRKFANSWCRTSDSYRTASSIGEFISEGSIPSMVRQLSWNKHFPYTDAKSGSLHILPTRLYIIVQWKLAFYSQMDLTGILALLCSSCVFLDKLFYLSRVHWPTS